MKTRLLWLSLLSPSCLALAQEKASYSLTSSSPQPVVTVAPPASLAPITSPAPAVQGGTSVSAEVWDYPYAPFQGPRVAGSAEVGYTAAGSLMSGWGIFGDIGVYFTPYLYIGLGQGATRCQDDRVGWLYPTGLVLRGRWPLSRALRLWVSGCTALPIPSKNDIDPGFYATALGGLEIGYFSVGLGVTTCSVSVESKIPFEQRHGLVDRDKLSGTGLTLRVGIHL